MTDNWFTSSVAPSFEDAPQEWLEADISGSFFNTKEYGYNETPH